MAKCYHAEVEWREKKYVPGTVEEYLRVSARSSGCIHLASQGSFQWEMWQLRKLLSRLLPIRKLSEPFALLHVLQARSRLQEYGIYGPSLPERAWHHNRAGH
uniref:Uncharacterized protein n=1 Tax=Setaria viridis TaxID=4556 RepID=A0A4U6U5U1_SETVI|nr:hypothetical protein SEVIR_6G067001v2 [Setaria viridis]